MTLKRALVVDDSKSARFALKKQLERYQLSVELAETGEEALEFLKTQMVDVVFMDHVMPGMNGLEAVKAIKSNPRTATIPVMMYTSKGGEVYVSQARALGAVDLLPKQVEPGVLFGMLLKLGLVRDRRATSRDASASEHVESSGDDADGEDKGQPVGIAMSSLLTRIIEDQHSTLRSDILASHRSFAKQVATEVYEQQMADQPEMPDEPPARTVFAGWPMLTGALAVALLFVVAMLLQVRTERDVVRGDLTGMATTVERERLSSIALAEELTSDVSDQRLRAESSVRELLGTLAWSMNQSGSVPFGERHFNDARTEQIRGLFWRLSNAGFQGTVRVESHLGEFCLASDSTGVYALADPDLPFATCPFVGHPLDESGLLSDRQTPGFETFVTESPLVNGSGIELEIVVRQRLESAPRVPYPIEPQSVGEWNQIAAQNNRVEFLLLSEPMP